jgi:hypothetical protein
VQFAGTDSAAAPHLSVHAEIMAICVRLWRENAKDRCKVPSDIMPAIYCALLIQAVCRCNQRPPLIPPSTGGSAPSPLTGRVGEGVLQMHDFRVMLGTETLNARPRPADRGLA